MTSCNKLRVESFPKSKRKAIVDYFFFAFIFNKQNNNNRAVSILTTWADLLSGVREAFEAVQRTISSNGVMVILLFIQLSYNLLIFIKRSSRSRRRKM